MCTSKFGVVYKDIIYSTLDYLSNCHHQCDAGSGVSRQEYLPNSEAGWSCCRNSYKNVEHFSRKTPASKIHFKNNIDQHFVWCVSGMFSAQSEA